MPALQEIRYLGRAEIDSAKWDDAISKSGNGLVYAYSWYLDAMADNWSALIQDDYEKVMPLTWNRKYGIAYLYQPFLTAQLGLFGNNITEAILANFLHAIPSKFRYWDFYLNHHNAFNVPEYVIYERMNFVLPLNKAYEDLYGTYRENIQRNIKKALQLGCTISKDIAVDDIITLAQRQMNRGQRSAAAKNINRFRSLFTVMTEKKMVSTYGVLSRTGQLLASCVFFLSHQRAYYILVGNHPDGRTLGASHLLIDAFIKENAGTDLLLDFEGSDIRNLAFFYSSFGATSEKYAGIRLNKLPFYIRWFKK